MIIWGIGLDVGDPRVQRQDQWLGRNVLGTALMHAREQLRGDGGGASSSRDCAEEEAPQGGDDFGKRPTKKPRTLSDFLAKPAGAGVDTGSVTKLVEMVSLKPMPGKPWQLVAASM